MFYTHVLLDKHGILAKIWIAAHWHKKLTKSNIFECNLESAINNILSAKMVMSLRISGHLLLGVVRVYNRKTKYLLADCNESLLKMKLAFRPEMLDLSDTNQEARYNAITLQEQFYDFDTQLPDLGDIDVVDHFTLNQSRAEDITMKEDYNKQLILRESFGNLDPLRQDFSMESSFEVSTNSVPQENSFVDINDDKKSFLNQDNFGDEGTAANFFASSHLFSEYNDLGIDESKEVTLPVSPHGQEQQFESELSAPDFGNTEVEMPMEDPAAAYSSSLQSEISFALEPLDIAEIEKRKRTRKKRKLMVDDLKQISSNFFRQQLEDTSDTLSVLDIGPPSRCMMEWKKTGGVQWLLSEPAQPVINADLQSLFTQNQKSGTAKKRQLDTPQKVQEMPAEPELETPLQDQEQQDLPQLETTAITDASSTYTEEPSGMQELAGFDQTVTHESSLVQEETTESSSQDCDEHRWTKRTHKMLNRLKKINQSGIITFSFNKMLEGNKKKQASANFYSLLVLKNRNAIRMSQNSPYSDISITPGPQFHIL
ncbi:double-strand-break repair protein rad21-like protein 1 isoform 2-T2 [Mantella aurantiaca]